MLSTNPVLANCKGSVKAVRLMMNMLGLKCIPIVNGLSATYTLHNLGADPSPDGICEAFSNGNEAEYYSYMVTNHYGLLFARKEDYDGYYSVFSMQISGPDNNNDSTITLIPWKDEEINRWNETYADRPNMQIDIADKDFAVRQRYTLLAYNDVVKNFKAYQSRTEHFEGVTISETYTTTAAQTNTSNDILICVPNVTDEDLRPIKEVLAKQMQEILPINMIVLPDHIIGCAINE